MKKEITTIVIPLGIKLGDKVKITIEKVVE